jgi:probable rRNA maturation factor
LKEGNALLFFMGSRKREIFLQNQSGRRLQMRPLSLFAAKVCTAAGLQGDVAILIGNDGDLRRMNHWYRGKDSATDVLSFPSDLTGHAGDIAISADIAVTNAKQLGHSLSDELKILVLHGVLHLAGFDHETDRGEMAEREAALRAKFGLPSHTPKKRAGART